MSKARMDRGVTQRQLAEALHCKQSTVSMIEDGSLEPEADLVARIKAWLASGKGAAGKAPRGPRGNYKKRQTLPPEEP